MNIDKNGILQCIKESEKNDYERYALALNFHENTKYGATKSRDDFLNIGLFRANPATLLASMRSFKEYQNCISKISLPSIAELVSAETEDSFNEILLYRRSIRNFTGNKIPFEHFARMLVMSYGITGSVKYSNNKDLFLRASPSGGGLYPLEIYVFVFNVTDLRPGLYHYNVRDNLLEHIYECNCQDKLVQIMQNQAMVKNCAAVIVISYMFERVLIKYRNRGMRFVYIDAGHLVENMSLVASSVGLGSCAVGGFNDYELEKLLNIDGFYESVVYSLVVGDPQ